MIINLNGMFETPEYKENTHIALYNNDENENYQMHWHSPIEILMPVENSYTVIINNKSYVVNPYELLFIGSGVIHSTIAPPTGRRYFLQIDASRIKNITGVNSILTFIGQVRHITSENAPAIHKQLVQLYEEICDEYFNNDLVDSISSQSPDEDLTRNALCEPIVYAKFLTMLTLMGRKHLESVETSAVNQMKKKEYTGKFMSICQYIDEHFSEEITLEEVAARSGFSKFHFSRLFKQFTNVSFYRYVNQQRITHAEELLSVSDLSVTQIAIQSGFSSTSAFIRMFKQFNNCTPTDFRKMREITNYNQLP